MLKILFNLAYYTHTEDLYKLLRVQPIDHIFELEQAKLVFKIIHKIQKSNHTIVYSSDMHTYELRNNNIRLNNAKTNMGLKNPISEASQMFNSLSDDIKREVSYNKFIKKLKIKFKI